DAAVAIVAVPLNVLGTIEFEPALSEAKQEAIELGQGSRGIKIFLRARGAGLRENAIRPGHPFGYLDTEVLFDDGTQLQIGCGPPQGASSSPAPTSRTAGRASSTARSSRASRPAPAQPRSPERRGQSR